MFYVIEFFIRIIITYFAAENIADFLLIFVTKRHHIVMTEKISKPFFLKNKKFYRNKVKIIFLVTLR
jgi:hypothetical protein